MFRGPPWGCPAWSTRHSHQALASPWANAIGWPSPDIYCPPPPPRKHANPPRNNLPSGMRKLISQVGAAGERVSQRLHDPRLLEAEQEAWGRGGWEGPLQETPHPTAVCPPKPGAAGSSSLKGAGHRGL